MSGARRVERPLPREEELSLRAVSLRSDVISSIKIVSHHGEMGKCVYTDLRPPGIRLPFTGKLTGLYQKPRVSTLG